MDKAIEKNIVGLMKRHKVMTIATNRPDGFPQATNVAYVNDGVDLYFCCAKDSQKAKNIRKSDKVSVTINKDYRDWSKIKGLSMGGHATLLRSKGDREMAYGLLTKKFPEMGQFGADDPSMAFVKVHPTVISVLDYTQEFGHTDLVKV